MLAAAAAPDRSALPPLDSSRGASSRSSGRRSGSSRHEADEEAACKDRQETCAQWARDGECRANPRHMLHVCKRSCNVCGL